MITRITPGCLGIWVDGDVVFYLYDLLDHSNEMLVCCYTSHDNGIQSCALGWFSTNGEESYE